MSPPSSSVYQLAFIVAAAMGVYSFVASSQDAETRTACSALCLAHPAYANDDRLLPDVTLPDLDGHPVSLRSFRGKTLLLNFWTKTCGPCREEMPSLAELAAILKAENEPVELVTLTSDESAEDARNTLAATLGTQAPPFLVLVDPGAQIISGRFGTHLYPETWFVDPSGVIRARVDGARDWANPVFLELARMLRHPSGCSITFDQGHPAGPHADLCDNL